MTSANSACAGLAFTGLGYSVLAIVVVALACLAMGIVLLGRGKGRGRVSVLVALLLALGACTAVGMTGPSSATAATPGCDGSRPSPGPTQSPAPSAALTVVQTSTIAGLAPGVPAIPISGVTTNTGPDSVFVEMVVVRVESVTKAPHAVAGSCDASNYVVLNPQMSVNQSVPPQGSVHFTGATIGFDNRATNQDACKAAMVRLTYELYES